MVSCNYLIFILFLTMHVGTGIERDRAGAQNLGRMFLQRSIHGRIKSAGFLETGSCESLRRHIYSAKISSSPLHCIEGNSQRGVE